MAWFVRSTRIGVHVVYSQQAQNSCGIACIIMVNFKMKKWQLGVAAMSELVAGPAIGIPAMQVAMDSTVKAEREVDAAYSRVSGQRYDGSAYTAADQLQNVLNELGIGTWKWELAPGNQLANKVIQHVAGPGSAPVIALVNWRGGGAHWVVCDAVKRTGTETLADFCDPWDAAVRTVTLTAGRPIVYEETKQAESFSFGQTHRDYGQSQTGDLLGCIIYRTGA